MTGLIQTNGLNILELRVCYHFYAGFNCILKNNAIIVLKITSTFELKAKLIFSHIQIWTNLLL